MTEEARVQGRDKIRSSSALSWLKKTTSELWYYLSSLTPALLDLRPYFLSFFHSSTLRETVESYLWSTDCPHLNRGIRTVRSCRPPPRCSSVKVADGTTLTEESEIRVRLVGYFEELYRAKAPLPPEREFPGDADAVQDFDPPVNWCDIYEVLKAGGAAALLCLHTLLCSIWNMGIIPTDWKRALSFRSGRKRKRVTPKSVTTTLGLPSSLCKARARHDFSLTGCAISC